MFFFLIALLIVVADQLTKIWIRSNVALYQSIPEHGFFQITHIRNTGAAFGLFPDQSFILTIVASAGVVLLLIYTIFFHRRFPVLDTRIFRLAVGLILGGTTGNLIDRLHLGYVTDFISIGIWPNFNVADSAVTVGALMITYSLLCLLQAENQ